MSHPTPLDLPKFPERLRTLRTERGYSQSQLANLTGTVGSYVSKLESGRQTPSLAVALRISRALGVTVEYLLGVS